MIALRSFVLARMAEPEILPGKFQGRENRAGIGSRALLSIVGAARRRKGKR